MAKKSLELLTETMFYVLMAFSRQDRCGIEIMQFVEAKTGGRVKLGPGTLYAILGKFEEEFLIKEVAVSGRKRTYRLTDKGRQLYQDEVARLRACLEDAQSEEETEEECVPAPAEEQQGGARGLREVPVFG